MSLHEALRHLARELHADWFEGEKPAFEITLATRQTGGDMRLLRYRVTLEVNEQQRILFFDEVLWEQHKAPPGGVDLTASLRSKEEAYRVAPGHERGTIEDQAAVFQARYPLQFDFGALRQKLAVAADGEGYRLKHLIPL